MPGSMSGHDPLDRPRLKIVLTTVALNVVAVALLTYVPWSDWRTGAVLNLIDNSLLLGFIWRRRDPLLARLVIFGVAVGFSELAADAWLVGHTRTLDYSVGGGPMLWCSPLFMPFAWEVVAVQFGYLGILLRERFGGMGLLAIGLLGAINIPYYEQLARSVHWWTYRGPHMLFATPWYIILGEFGIAIALTLLAKFLRVCGWAASAALGVAGGVAIFLCYAVAFELIDLGTSVGI